MIDPKTGFNVRLLKSCKDGYWALEQNPRNREFWMVYLGPEYNPCPNWGPYGTLMGISGAWMSLE